MELYLDSLRAVGIDPLKHDIRFVEDDWESPTLGAWGLGWEVWLDGMEITQFTYFQQCGGIDLKPVSGEITYGLERIAMYLQNVNNVFDLKWVRGRHVRRRAPPRRGRVVRSTTSRPPTSAMLFSLFTMYEKECRGLMGAKLVLPAYDYCLKCSHAFNMLDARGRHLRHGAHLLHRPGPEPGAPLRGRVPEVARGDGLPAAREVLRLNRNHPRRGNPMERDYLLEIGCEEIPAGFVGPALWFGGQQFEGMLKKARLSFRKIDIYGTPRRLAYMVRACRTGRRRRRRP